MQHGKVNGYGKLRHSAVTAINRCTNESKFEQYTTEYSKTATVKSNNSITDLNKAEC